MLSSLLSFVLVEVLLLSLGFESLGLVFGHKVGDLSLILSLVDISEALLLSHTVLGDELYLSDVGSIQLVQILLLHLLGCQWDLLVGVLLVLILLALLQFNVEALHDPVEVEVVVETQL